MDGPNEEIPSCQNAETHRLNDLPGAAVASRAAEMSTRWPVCIVLLSLAACAPTIKPTVDTSSSASEPSELWVMPTDLATRDLRYGVGGAASAPDPQAEYVFHAKDTKGFSDGYDVTGPDGVEWSVKIGPEAQPEVVASRLLWAAGFHQPPAYYVPQWRLTGGPEPGIKGPARFRPKATWLHKTGEWSWQRNPFVDSPAFRGLIVLNLMLNNADLRTPNNIIYTLRELRDGAERWFVVRDLGGSLGATGFVYGTRNDLEGFERQRFVTRVQGSHVSFDYHGRHRELLRLVTPADVRWAAERWAVLTDAQWQAAFEAGGYQPDVAARYIQKLRAKIAEGLALPQ